MNKFMIDCSDEDSYLNYVNIYGDKELFTNIDDAMDQIHKDLLENGIEAHAYTIYEIVATYKYTPPLGKGTVTKVSK